MEPKHQSFGTRLRAALQALRRVPHRIAAWLQESIANYRCGASLASGCLSFFCRCAGRIEQRGCAHHALLPGLKALCSSLYHLFAQLAQLQEAFCQTADGATKGAASSKGSRVTYFPLLGHVPMSAIHYGHDDQMHWYCTMSTGHRNRRYPEPEHSASCRRPKPWSPYCLTSSATLTDRFPWMRLGLKLPCCKTASACLLSSQPTRIHKSSSQTWNQSLLFHP